MSLDTLGGSGSSFFNILLNCTATQNGVMSVFIRHALERDLLDVLCAALPMSGQGRCGISCLRLGLLGRYNGQSSVEAHKLFAGTCDR